MGSCFKVGRQAGPWYELKALRNHMDARAASDEDVTWYKEIYFAWLHDAEYQKADAANIAKGLYGRLDGAPEGVTSLLPDKDYGGTVEMPLLTGVTPPEVEKRIKTLLAEGLSTRAVAAALEKEGTRISHMTVSRIRERSQEVTA